jgi:hypothetical protein
MLKTTFARMRRGAITILVIAACAADAGAQSRAVAPEDLARRAEVVALGRVNDVSSEWNENRSMIRTRVTLAVGQYVKGTGTGATLVIYVPGGEVDGVGEMYSHMATFKKDEQVLVFAEKDQQGRYRVSGGQQGKFDVRKDEATGKAFVGNRPIEDVARAVQKSIGVSTQK